VNGEHKQECAIARTRWWSGGLGDSKNEGKSPDSLACSSQEILYSGSICKQLEGDRIMASKEARRDAMRRDALSDDERVPPSLPHKGLLAAEYSTVQYSTVQQARGGACMA
jgi:hypothetical protein